MTTEQEVRRLQDQAWSVEDRNWKDDKYGVINFLQTEWEKQNFTKSVDYNQYNMSQTAQMVLEHWYGRYDGNRWYRINSPQFSQWLHQQYKDYMTSYAAQRYGGEIARGEKLNPPDNRPLPPRQKSRYS